MRLDLEVLASITVKRKKPSRAFAWLGKPSSSYGLFLLDGSHISQLSLETGRTQGHLNRVHLALTAVSSNGAYLGGLTTDGRLLLWHKATDEVLMYESPLGNGPVVDVQGHKLFVSDSGEQALLVCNWSEFHLWEMGEAGRYQWWKILPPDGVALPQSTYRETSIDACFFVHPVLGESCICAFAFTNRQSKETTVTHLLIRWGNPVEQFYCTHSSAGKVVTPGSSGVVLLQLSRTAPRETSNLLGGENAQPEDVKKGDQKRKVLWSSEISHPLRETTNLSENQSLSREPFQPLPSTVVSVNSSLIVPEQVSSDCSGSDAPFMTQWNSKSCSQDDGNTQLPSQIGKGSYVAKFSPTGDMLALAINQNCTSDSQVLFCSLITDGGVSSPIYRNTSVKKSGRTYWIADMAWSADGLLLVCMTRRGCLMILPRCGPPLKLFTHGCSLEMGPSSSLPLHPLITIVGTNRSLNITDHENSQSSERDDLRQRFSVATHPHLPIILCSDGYSLTVMRINVETLSLPELVRSLVDASRRKLGLPPSEALKNTREHFSVLNESTDKESNDPDAWKSLLPRELSGCTDQDLDYTLAHSIATAGGMGPLSETSGIEEGVIHFAGVESDLEQTQVLASEHEQLRHSTEQAITYLCTALAMLLTTDKFTPGNGMYPRDTALSGKEIVRYNLTIEHTSHLLVSTLVSAIQRTAVSSVPQDLKAEFFTSMSDVALLVLDLMVLDSIKKSHFSLSVSLVNGLSWAVLSECSKIKQRLPDLCDDKEENLQSLRETTDLIGSVVTTVSHFISEVLAHLDEVYGSEMTSFMTDSDLEDVHAPISSATGCNLAVPLLSIAKFTSAFASEIQSYMSAAQKIVPRHITSRLQCREFELLYYDLTNSIQQATSALKSIETTVGYSLRTSGVVSSNEHSALVMEDSPHSVQLAGKLITSKQQQQQGQQQAQLQQQLNQLTTMGIPLIPSVHGSLTSLLRRLEQYDLKGALQLAHSLLVDPIAVSDQDVCSDSPFEKKPVDGTGQSLSAKQLSSLYQEEALSVTSAEDQMSTTLPLAPVESRDGLAVMSCLARFMVSFFINYPLLLPPSTTSLATLPTLNLSLEQGPSRYIDLDRSLVTEAVREQNLSAVWTPDLTLGLLLRCELWEEACHFVASLGDWRKAFLIASVYLCHSQKLTQLCPDLEASVSMSKFKTVCHQLAVRDISGQLSSLGSYITSETDATPMEHECLDAMQPPNVDIVLSISRTLQVCAMVEMDSVLMTSLHTLIVELEATCKQLPVLAPSAIYLPAPPMYCLQPGISNEDYVQSPMEWRARRKLAILIQHLLTVFRASHCLPFFVQWYSQSLQSLHTTPEGAPSELSLPSVGGDNNTARVCQRLLDRGPRSSLSFIPDVLKGGAYHSIQFLEALFRHLCGLLWFLHVRDQASLHLRKVHPTISLPTPNLASTDSTVLKEAALWSARLLPFSDLLSHSNVPEEASDMALSAMLELPCGTFLANLLALCFPHGTIESSLRLNAKLSRLISKLRSVPNPQPEDHQDQPVLEPLSVRYQSKSQRVLMKMEKSSICKFRDFVPSYTSELDQDKPVGVAPEVNNYSFEHDEDYLNFLETLFAVVSFTDEKMSSQLLEPASGQGTTSHPQPYLGSFCSLISASDPSISCWKQLLPLVSTLSEWSKRSAHSTTNASSSRPTHDGQSKKSVGPTLRVEVPVPLILNCLQAREEQLLNAVEKQVDVCDGSPTADGEENEVDKTQSLWISDLQDTALKPHLEPTEDAAGLHQISLEPSLLPEDNSVASISFLQVPEGVLQGKVSPDALPGITIQRSVVSPQDQSPPCSEVVPDTLPKAPVEKDQVVDSSLSHTEAFTLDDELTESISTGELPSAVTFSIGEFGSRLPPGDDTIVPEIGAFTKLHTTHASHDSAVVQAVDSPCAKGTNVSDSCSQGQHGGGGEAESEEGEQSQEMRKAEEEEEDEEEEVKDGGGEGSGHGSEDDHSGTEKESDSSSSTSDESQSSTSSSSQPKETPKQPDTSILHSPPHPLECSTLTAVIENRARHTSGATTITTDFSDSHGARQPSHLGSSVILPPAVIESSITTGSTEEEMRQLGLRPKTGPVQSTAVKAPPVAQEEHPQAVVSVPASKPPAPAPAPAPTKLPAGSASPFLQPVADNCPREDGRKKEARSRRGGVATQLGDREKIGRIVKSEMKKLLKLQHEKLLDLLDTTTTTTSDQTVPEEPLPASPEETCQPQSRSDTDSAPVSHTGTDQSIAPLLDLDELQSTVYPDQPTHVTVPMTPTEVEASLQQMLSSGKLSGPAEIQPADLLSTGEEVKAVQLAPDGACSEAETTEENKRHSTDLSMSELTSEEYSLGAALPRLGSGSYTQQKKHSRRKENRVTFKAPMEVSAKSEAVVMCDSKPALLHVDLLSQPPAKIGRRERVGTLQQEYPHLATSLRQFDSFVGSQHHFLSAGFHSPPPLCMTDLRAEGASNQLPPAPMGQLPHRLITRPSPVVGHSISLPLLHIPDERDTLPGMVPLSSNTVELPSVHYRPSANAKEEPASHVPVSCPPLLNTSIHPFAKIQPASPLHSKDQFSPEYKLAQVPLEPYVPRLIPPHLLEEQQTTREVGVPPLLRLDDPLERMKRDGFQLLQLHPEEMGTPDHLPHIPHLIKVPVPAAGRKEGLMVPQTVSVASDEPTVAVGRQRETPAQTSTEDRPHRRQKSKSRMRRKKGKETEERPPNETPQARPKAVVLTRGPTGSRKPKEVQPRIINETTSPLPISGTELLLTRPTGPVYSDPVQSKSTYPDTLPQERLEVRRLEMRALYLHSSTSEHEEEEVKRKAVSNVATLTDPVGNEESSAPLSRHHHKSLQCDIQREQEWASKSIQVELVLTDKSVQAEQVSCPLEAPLHTKQDLPIQVDAQPNSRTRQYLRVVDIEGAPDVSMDVNFKDDDLTTPAAVSPSKEDRSRELGKSEEERVRKQSVVEKEKEEEEEFEEQPGAEKLGEEENKSKEELAEKVEDKDVGGIEVGAVLGAAAVIYGMPHSGPEVEPESMNDAQHIVPAHSGRLGTRSKVIQQLQQLEEQLNAIESTARMVEGEFQTSAQLLQTIDKLGVVSDPMPTATTTSSLSSTDSETSSNTTDSTTSTLKLPLPVSEGVGTPLCAISVTTESQEDIDTMETHNEVDQLHRQPQHKPSSVHGEKQLPEVLADNQEMTVWKSMTTHSDDIPVLSPSSLPRGGQPAKPSITVSKLPGTKPKGHVQFVEDKGSGGRSLYHLEKNGPRDSVGGRGGGREEIRQWMELRRKQRLKELNTDRGSQRKASTELTRLRDERRHQKRQQEKEFHAKRIEDAFSLMQDILTSKPKKPRMSPQLTSSTTTEPSVVVTGQRSSAASAGKPPFSAKHPPRASRGSPRRAGGKTPRTASTGSDVRANFLSGTCKPHLPSRSSSEIAVGSQKSSKTGSLNSSETHKVRRISSVEGLTEDEQERIATILASTERDRDGSMVSPGSVASSIDWDEVDKILEN